MKADSQGKKHLLLYDLQTLKSAELQKDFAAGKAIWTPDSKNVIVADETSVKKYDVASGTWNEVYKYANSGQIVPAELLVHPSDPILFLVDKKTGLLYRLDY